MFDPKKMIDMIKQASYMQNEFQNKLKDIIVNGTSGGDMVSISMNGQFEILNLKIDHNIVNKKEIKFLEDLLIAAFNDALNKAKKESSIHMKSLTSNLNL